jgi:hypothetical protein
VSLPRVALLFTDGVGVGARDPDENPLARGEFLLSQFADGGGTALPAGGQLHRVDTTFGVAGRPQSASNQTAIYTGTDAPRLVGEHILGYPSVALRKLIAEESIVRRLPASTSVSFANAYPAEYLAALELKHTPASGPDLKLPARFRRRMKASASTLAMAAGGLHFRTFDDARAGRALTNDIDGSHAAQRGVQVPSRSLDEAAEIFWAIAGDFTLFEHFLADEAGHEQSFEAAHFALSSFDAFARAVIARKPANSCVLICSDHGNVENLTTRNHTVNPVALLSFGLPLPFVPHTVADAGRLVLRFLRGTT